MDDPLLSPEMVCDLLPGMTVANLKDLRASGRGPRYSKPTGGRGRITLYRRSDVLRWVDDAMISTRDQPSTG
ncbi:hypothetical protein QE375_000946 [Microbacterium foliorum]|uniref:Helix-turn-helix domain-containing protein n=1 Tax=Microbacterium foliorum TaxID=104336 RepID=A0ABU1HMX2_9MICO|nr:hypothetical protein [Microbacterium foliorum]MDR6141392.1 hypothetical protein [Microbacterium foliorum]